MSDKEIEKCQEALVVIGEASESEDEIYDNSDLEKSESEDSNNSKELIINSNNDQNDKKSTNIIEDKFISTNKEFRNCIVKYKIQCHQKILNDLNIINQNLVKSQEKIQNLNQYLEKTKNNFINSKNILNETFKNFEELKIK